MFTSHAWIVLAESVEEADLGELQVKCDALRYEYRSIVDGVPEDPVQQINVSTVLQFSVEHNHLGDSLIRLRQLLGWVLEHLPGSHGVALWKHEPSGIDSLTYHSIVLANRGIYEHSDPVFGPAIAPQGHGLGPLPPDEGTQARDLSSLNTILLQAEEAGNGNELSKRITDDFTIIRASGVRQNKNEFVAAAAGGANKGRVQSAYEELPLGEAMLVRLKITTHLTKKNETTGQEETIIAHYWNTRVFVQDGAEWKCKAWQVTEIK